MITESDFFNEAKKMHPNMDFSNSIYTGLNNKIKVGCKVHGFFQRRAGDFKRNKSCPKCGDLIGRKKQTIQPDKIYERLVESKPNIFFYKESITTMKGLVKCSCGKHGVFHGNARIIIKNKHGCPKCAIEARNKIMRVSFDDFVKKANKVHNNKYQYVRDGYISQRGSVGVICSKHGLFNQNGTHHLNGSGCRFCVMIGCKRSMYIEKCKNKYKNKAVVYLIRCFDKNETFYKIGITMVGVKKRFKNTLMPYNYTKLSEICLSGEDAWNSETMLHQSNWGFLYKPKIKFFGSMKECFSNLTIETLDFFGV